MVAFFLRQGGDFDSEMKRAVNGITHLLTPPALRYRPYAFASEWLRAICGFPKAAACQSSMRRETYFT